THDIGSDPHTLSAMARICRALDGMPLAIELAAARLRTMSVDQLARRLDDRFRLLTGGSRTALPRHKTLRAVVDWSWDLLTEAERGVLRRLSVFSGGASLEAAERVCGDEASGEQTLDVLTALIEKSLLLADGEGTPRYRMLNTIREYAAHRLAEAGGERAGAPGTPRLLHRAGRDGRPAPAPGRAAGVAVHARRREGQHQRRPARGDRRGMGAGGDAAGRGRRLVLVPHRVQDRGHQAEHRGGLAGR
ncbi:ATP-binding protein, partial [Streptosporangium vulgare]|uniref:ATP-binding protein n=1 Tax=Streptosporangium vulgare TaxID=46190 RepID=UPI003CD0B66F